MTWESRERLIARAAPSPVSSAVAFKTEVSMARTAKGLCGLCARPLNEDGECRREDCGRAPRPHYHLCSECLVVFECAGCPEAWKATYGSCGCGVPVVLGGEAGGA